MDILLVNLKNMVNNENQTIVNTNMFDVQSVNTTQVTIGEPPVDKETKQNNVNTEHVLISTINKCFSLLKKMYYFRLTNYNFYIFSMNEDKYFKMPEVGKYLFLFTFTAGAMSICYNKQYLDIFKCIPVTTTSALFMKSMAFGYTWFMFPYYIYKYPALIFRPIVF